MLLKIQKFVVRVVARVDRFVFNVVCHIVDGVQTCIGHLSSAAG